MKKSIICMLLILALLISAFPTAIFAAESDITETSVDPTDIVSISAGADMSAAVRADGTLWTWGCNELSGSGATWGNHWSFDIRNQSLGVAAGEHVDSTPMMAFSNNTQSVVCGSGFSGTTMYSSYPVPLTAVLDTNNSLWLWGGFRYGALGNGEDYSGNLWKPYKVLDDVVSYDTSGLHSAAVTVDGSLYMWGYNNCGQLGNGTTENLSVPTKIMDDVDSVSLGGYFSAAIKTDGSLWTWGSNYYGQLGNGTTENSSVPIKVMDKAKSIALGSAYSMAIARNGSLWVWGQNNRGQLGLGNKTDKYEPTCNEDFENDIIMIDTGENHSAALLETGDLYMWGANDNGQLGNKSKTDRSSSARIMKDVQQIALGMQHTLVLKTDGTLWAWGDNNYGQLGDRTKDDQTKPVEIHIGRINVSFSGNNVQKKTLDVPWEDAYLYDKSVSYNQDMAVCGLLLSESAYNNASTVFGEFGYTCADQEYNGEYPSYYVGYKILWDYDSPHIHIILAIRGTTTNDDLINDVRSVVDNFEHNGDHFIDAISMAEEKIISRLKKDNINISLTRKNTKFFLTGHSLGGACAGKTGLMMADSGMALANNLYVYTYASPKFNNRSEWSNAVPRMFNIINTRDDIIPNYPQCDFTASRAGSDKFYFTDDGGQIFWDRLYELYDGNIPDNWNYGDWWHDWGAHMTPVYLAMLLSSDPNDTFEHDYMNIFNRIRMIRVHCPVEVEVYDPKGSLCAYTSNGTVNYSENSPVMILIEGEEKTIGLPDSREYAIRYVGTDTGSMKVEDQIYSTETGELEYEKVFENVALEYGKLLSSNIDGTDDTENTDLNVIDEEGDPVSSVNESGQETLLGKYDLDEDDIILPTGSFCYNGEAITPSAAVENLIEGTDYRVIYKNNTTTGKATVVVKGINDYRGRFTSTFSIYGNGDADGNGEIEAIDTTFILRYIALEQTPYAKEQLINGDVDSSGDLELPDATAIQYYLAQLETPYPIGIES